MRSLDEQLAARRARPHAPYGYVEQRELAWLRERGAPPADRLTLLVLRVRRNWDGWTRDGVASVASWSGLSRSTVERSLVRLERLGIVHSTERERATGGPRGFAWRKRRQALPFVEWPKQAEEAVNVMDSSLGRDRQGEPKSPSNQAEESARVTDNPETYPKGYSKESDASRRSVASLRSPSTSLDGETHSLEAAAKLVRLGYRDEELREWGASDELIARARANR